MDNNKVLDAYVETNANSNSPPRQSRNNNQTPRDKSIGLRAVSGKYVSNKTILEESSVFEKVLVVGLGQLGLPVAKYLTDRGFDTYGYDVNNKAMERAQEIAAVKKVTNLNDIDVFIICVSTHKPEDMFSPQVDGLLSVIEDISRKAKNGALVSIESTIPRGTSRKVFEMLNHRLHVAHVPHRFYSLEEKDHGINQLRVIGGVCDCCLENAIKLYGSPAVDVIDGVIVNSKEGSSNNITHDNTYRGNNLASLENTKSLGIPLHPVSNIEIAEISKIAENAHRYLQIAFAEDLYLYCQANEINFAELREALNTKWNVNILEPRDGIGGHCLPKDTKMFLQSSISPGKSKILSAAMEVDHTYRDYRKAKYDPSKLEAASVIPRSK
jgi:UDP-N-acetyl-D-mannosaminuronic acid dehydrogenase